MRHLLLSVRLFERRRWPYNYRIYRSATNMFLWQRISVLKQRFDAALISEIYYFDLGEVPNFQSLQTLF